MLKKKCKMYETEIKTKLRLKSLIFEWLFVIISVTALMFFYYLITWWAMEPYLSNHIFLDYVNTKYAKIEILLQGVSFGLMFGVITLFTNKEYIRKKSIGTIVLIKTVLYILAIIISQYFVYAIYITFNIVSKDILLEMQNQLDYRFLLAMSIYFFMVILLINTVLVFYHKLGYGELINIITGKYRKPKQEYRVFMLLDMKDSTKNAEMLGNSKYSQLIQNCIHDLTDLIILYKANVYQYVGDEIALTWNVDISNSRINAIKLFFAFQQTLQSKSDQYMKKYSIVPEFKAGVDEGMVTVTEVGDIKRDLAYHGEVLHTAARLEKMCNNLGNKILITNELRENIDITKGFDVVYMGDHLLRGKTLKEKVYGIVINRLPNS